MTQIEIPGSAPALGPYSKAISTGNMLFISGQAYPNATTVEEQAEETCKIIGKALEAAGFSFADVVKTTCFLTNMDDFAAFNAVYAKYFISKPARSCVEVSKLPAKNALCEIETIAVK